MNSPGDDLAFRKKLLVARSTLSRLRIRHDAQVLRESLTWRQAASVAASSSTARDAVFLVALQGLGRERMARWLAVASRTLMFARLASIALAMLRKPRGETVQAD